MSNTENQNVIRVKFDDNGRADGRTYCYHNPFAGVKVGDRVIVDSPFNGYTAVSVVEVDVQIRNKATKEVVSLIDDSAYVARKRSAERLAQIDKAIADKKRKTRAEMEERLLSQMLASDPEIQELEAEKMLLKSGNLVYSDFAEMENRMFFQTLTMDDLFGAMNRKG